MTDTDALKRRLNELSSEHRALDDDISRMTENPLFDQLEVQRLKKRKLALKDQMTKLENRILPDIIA